MPTVTVQYRLINSAGHHRQPRTGPTWTALPGGSTIAGQPGADATADAIPVEGATFLFWSASDGEGGKTTTNQHVSQTIGANPLSLVAWYLPVGGDGTGGPAVLLDAFSITIGDFVDDDFATVTSNPALTAQANVAGVVPTDVAQTLVANGNVHGGAFVEWIGTGSALGSTLSLAAGISGFSIATYRTKKIEVGQIDLNIREGWLIFGGIASDGDGFVIPIGGGPGGGPVGPWGPFVAQVARLLNIGVSSAAMGRDGIELQRSALGKLAALTKTQTAQIGKLQGPVR